MTGTSVIEEIVNNNTVSQMMNTESILKMFVNNEDDINEMNEVYYLH